MTSRIPYIAASTYRKVRRIFICASVLAILAMVYLLYAPVRNITVCTAYHVEYIPHTMSNLNDTHVARCLIEQAVVCTITVTRVHNELTTPIKQCSFHLPYYRVVKCSSGSSNDVSSVCTVLHQFLKEKRTALLVRSENTNMFIRCRLIAHIVVTNDVYDGISANDITYALAYWWRAVRKLCLDDTGCDSVVVQFLSNTLEWNANALANARQQWVRSNVVLNCCIEREHQ